ncbi:MAG TPA: TIGR01777 family oxidoreductase [Bacteriovoracaceae bacterium]|nr:TIGR01777 family oxidoreductase [Bacteriovoracaceae bacterium]
MRVLVTGATGFIGKVIVKQLLDSGDQVVVLTSNIAKAAIRLGSECKYFQWSDTNTLPPQEAFEGVDGVIHLMGESIANKRWDEEQKKKIYDSRIQSTSRLVERMAMLEKKPKTLVSTSAVGIYGDRGEEEITEKSAVANDFLAHVCKNWENEASRATSIGCRVSIIRTGVVLGKGGGALAKMLPIFKKGIGGPLGSGKQYMSWIHIDDLAALYIECLKNPVFNGVFNGTAPYPATNKEFSRALGKALHRPALIPAPNFAIKAAFGEMSSILLQGQKVLPAKSKEVKFRYRYPTLDMALKETAH